MNTRESNEANARGIINDLRAEIARLTDQVRGQLQATEDVNKTVAKWFHAYQDEFAAATKLRVEIESESTARLAAEKRAANGWAEAARVAAAYNVMADRAVAAEATLVKVREALEKLAEMFHDLSENRRIAEMDEWARDARRWRSEGDMYGWNFCEGMRAGANATDILYQRLGTEIRAILTSPEGGTTEGKG